ncbi:MAG: Gfo/Idh/MocA family oxidoreductase [Chloroflexia bacterium]
MLSPLCARARDVIASGALGTISSVEARATHSGADDRPWLFTRAGRQRDARHGGARAHVGREPRRAGRAGRGFHAHDRAHRTINGQAHDVDIDDNVALLLEFESGALGNIVANYTTIADHAPQYSVYGTEGTIHVGAPGSPFQLYVHKEQYAGSQGWLSPTLFRGHKARPVTETTPYEAHGVQPDTSLGHFVECILEDREPVPGGEFARHVLEIMVKGAEAGRTGVAQQISSTFKPLAG